MSMCNTNMDLVLDKLFVDGVTYTRNDELLGKGGFGVVFSGSGPDNSKVAVKCQFVCEQNSKKNIVKEYGIHRELTKNDTNGFIIRIFGMHEIPNAISFILELAPQTLFEKLKFKAVATEEAHTYFKMLIDGVEFLHSEMVVHCDIKPENLLISDGTLKIADFGKAKKMECKDQQFKKEECIGTKQYAAPELWGKETVEGQPLDVWCCGIVLCQLTQASLELWEWADSSDKQYSRWVELTDGAKLTRSDFCYKFKPITMALLKRILCKEPSRRITIEGIKQHPYLTGETAGRKRKTTGTTGKAAKRGKN